MSPDATTSDGAPPGVPGLLEACADALGATGDAGRPAVLRAARDVLARYAEPHRRYHDLRHLAEVVTALRSLSPDPPATVLCAACFHDAVYEPAAHDNEHRSAVLAEQVLRRLGWPPTAVQEVVRLVLLTATHAPAPGDEAGALLCDADLAVLAAAPERYLAYAADVRGEYAHLDEQTFRAGRAEVLRALVGRSPLFTTVSGHRRWDARARRNVRDELGRLGAGPPP